ncbi:MAG: hypothetical protein ACLRVT_04860 [Oscillospiraceae bacterium]
MWTGPPSAQDRDACTVDGCHPNDLGFYRMAHTLRPVVGKFSQTAKLCGIPRWFLGPIFLSTRPKTCASAALANYLNFLKQYR